MVVRDTSMEKPPSTFFNATEEILKELNIPYENEDVVLQLTELAQNFLIKTLEDAKFYQKTPNEICKEDVKLAIDLRKSEENEIKPLRVEEIEQISEAYNETPITIKEGHGLRICKENLGETNYQLKSNKVPVVEQQFYANPFCLLPQFQQRMINQRVLQQQFMMRPKSMLDQTKVVLKQHMVPPNNVVSYQKLLRQGKIKPQPNMVPKHLMPIIQGIKPKQGVVQHKLMQNPMTQQGFLQQHMVQQSLLQQNVAQNILQQQAGLSKQNMLLKRNMVMDNMGPAKKALFLVQKDPQNVNQESGVEQRLNKVEEDVFNQENVAKLIPNQLEQQNIKVINRPNIDEHENRNKAVVSQLNVKAQTLTKPQIIMGQKFVISKQNINEQRNVVSDKKMVVISNLKDQQAFLYKKSMVKQQEMKGQEAQENISVVDPQNMDTSEGCAQKTNLQGNRSFQNSITPKVNKKTGIISKMSSIMDKPTRITIRPKVNLQNYRSILKNNCNKEN